MDPRTYKHKLIVDGSAYDFYTWWRGKHQLLPNGGVLITSPDQGRVFEVDSEGEITFWTVRMKPGKPLAFGTLKATDRNGKAKKIPHLGFPGNPVSSMVTFELFARPAMLKMMGKKNLAKPMVEAVLEEPAKNTDGRRVYTRAIVTKRHSQYYARLTGPQGSGILTSMSLANGMVIVPEDKASLEAGEIAKVIMLNWDDEDNIG